MYQSTEVVNQVQFTYTHHGHGFHGYLEFLQPFIFQDGVIIQHILLSIDLKNKNKKTKQEMVHKLESFYNCQNSRTGNCWSVTVHTEASFTLTWSERVLTNKDDPALKTPSRLSKPNFSQSRLTLSRWNGLPKAPTSTLLKICRLCLKAGFK